VTRHLRKFKNISANAGVFASLLLVVFVSELAVKELFCYQFARLDTVAASLLHAAILALLYGFPLWYLIIRPLFVENPADKPLLRSAPVVLFMEALSAIFLVEYLVMLVLPEIFPGLNAEARSYLDISLNILLGVPLLRWLLFRPGIRGRRPPLTDLLDSPLKLYVVLLSVVFLLDLLESMVIPLIITDGNQMSRTFVDPFLITVFTAPFLWLFMIRPLKHAALLERTRYNALQVQVIEAIMTIDAHGVIHSFNPVAERLFGYTAADVLGKSATLLLCDDPQCLSEMVREAAANNSDEIQHMSHEVSGRCRDGSVLAMDVSVSRLLLDGRQTFLVIMRDITSRKATEEALRTSGERFRQLFEQSEDAIIFFKPGTCSIIDTNETATKLYGFSKTELRAGGLKRLCKLEDFARLCKFVSGISDCEVSCLDNVVNLQKDGTEIIVSIRGKVITLLGVNIIYCTFRNVTDRLRMEEEARNIQAKLIYTNKMTSLGLMVSGVAHEINNPNNFITANAQVLAKSWDDALKVLREYQRENGDFLLGGIPFSEMEEYSPQLFAGIIDGARRIKEIISNLKSFARQERAMVESDVNVNEVATMAVSILHHELVRHTDNFHLDLAKDIPLIKGSKQQLGQVIINLLMNACQALPTRQRGIWMATGFDATADQVTITVRDQGCGMSREVSDRIIEPFFTTKLDNDGTGLGLSICQSIVKEHSGTMEFKSEPGKGTTFVVKIPAIHLP
jgi:PAS domain S-box-containing protein